MSAEMDDRSRGAVDLPRPARRRRGRWLALLLVIGVVAACWLGLRGRTVPPGSVLYLDWSQPLPERAGAGLLDLVEKGPGDLFDLTRALGRAAEDAAVSGLLVRLAPGTLAPGMADELRGLLRRFRNSGKPVAAFASAPDTWSYYVATAAERLVLDQSTTFDAAGLRLHAFFLKDALHRFGIELDLVRVGDFKGAYEELALAAPTPEFEEAANALIDSLSQAILDDIAATRGLESPVVRALFDQVPILPADAVREKLVDASSSIDGAVAWLRERTGTRPELIAWADYLAARDDRGGARKRFAVIHVLGTILDGESRPFALGGHAAGADTIVRQLQAAAADPAIAGILMRIDSPGGSVSAAETLHEAVSQARKAKPLVASCGSTAASGGYYVACAAERIVVQPTTLTGSIGVFGGKVVVQDLLEEHQVASRVYARGKRARLTDPTRRYTPEERQALKALLDDAYRRFVGQVAVGRRKGFEEIHALAQGRVWTGQKAMEIGLADQLGGLDEAASLLRELAHVPGSEGSELCLWPPRESLWSVLLGGQDGGGSSLPSSPAWGAVGEAIPTLERAESLLHALGLRRGTAQLSLLPCWLQVR